MIEFYPSAPGLYYVDRQGKTIRLDRDSQTYPTLPSPESEILIALLHYALDQMEGKPAEKPTKQASADPLNLAQLAEQTTQIMRALFR